MCSLCRAAASNKIASHCVGKRKKQARGKNINGKKASWPFCNVIISAMQ
jgi:hypothetical protein